MTESFHTGDMHVPAGGSARELLLLVILRHGNPVEHPVEDQGERTILKMCRTRSLLSFLPNMSTGFVCTVGNTSYNLLKEKVEVLEGNRRMEISDQGLCRGRGTLTLSEMGAQMARDRDLPPKPAQEAPGSSGATGLSLGEEQQRAPMWDQ